jgi:hypothetical protein
LQKGSHTDILDVASQYDSRDVKFGRMTVLNASTSASDFISGSPALFFAQYSAAWK